MLKKILSELPDNQRKELLLALEQEMSHYVIVNGDTFIGVNVNLKNLVPIEVAGKWSYGKISI